MTKRQAYDAGRAAYRRGASYGKCFYRDPEHVKEWERGWKVAQKLKAQGKPFMSTNAES